MPAIRKQYASGSSRTASGSRSCTIRSSASCPPGPRYGSSAAGMSDGSCRFHGVQHQAVRRRGLDRMVSSAWENAARLS